MTMIDDRGRIAPELRADIVRVAERGGLPLVRAGPETAPTNDFP